MASSGASRSIRGSARGYWKWELPCRSEVLGSLRVGPGGNMRGSISLVSVGRVNVSESLPCVGAAWAAMKVANIHVKRMIGCILELKVVLCFEEPTVVESWELCVGTSNNNIGSSSATLFRDECEMIDHCEKISVLYRKNLLNTITWEAGR